MGKVICYNVVDSDIVQIEYPAPRWLAARSEEIGEGAAIQLLIATRIDEIGSNITVINSEKLPNSYRDAWVFDNSGSVIVDMVKAKNIYRDKLRLSRIEPMEELDRLQKTAIVTNSSVAIGNSLASVVNVPTGSYTADEIESKLQEYRDAPDHASIEAAQTPEELSELKVAGLTI